MGLEQLCPSCPLLTLRIQSTVFELLLSKWACLSNIPPPPKLSGLRNQKDFGQPSRLFPLWGRLNQPQQEVASKATGPAVVLLEVRCTEAKGLRGPSLRGRTSSSLSCPTLGAGHTPACPTSTLAASSLLRLPRRITFLTALRRLNYRWRSPLRPWMKGRRAARLDQACGTLGAISSVRDWPCLYLSPVLCHLQQLIIEIKIAWPPSFWKEGRNIY